ncbi:amino acid oxidase, partial [Candidatus Beckwithbacteria bacterium CG22_combo_CG10-13_8_21_14_all_01_47_9]
MNGKEQKTDCIIIGAGIFGLYAALLLVKRGQSVAVIDKSLRPFSRASAINQARVHNGYHYPRSCDTAEKVADYYNRFIKDFDFAINNSFQQIYAIASNGSKTSAQGFINFCKKVNIPL